MSHESFEDIGTPPYFEDEYFNDYTIPDVGKLPFALAHPSSQFMAAILDYADPEVAKGIVEPYPYEQFIDYFGQYYDGY